MTSEIASPSEGERQNLNNAAFGFANISSELIGPYWVQMKQYGYTTMLPPYLSIKDISGLTGLGKTTIYRRVNDGTFPKPIKIGFRSLWKRDELLSCLTALEAARPQ